MIFSSCNNINLGVRLRTFEVKIFCSWGKIWSPPQRMRLQPSLQPEDLATTVHACGYSRVGNCNLVIHKVFPRDHQRQRQQQKEMYYFLCSLQQERHLWTRVTSLPYIHFICVVWVGNTCIPCCHSCMLRIFCMRQSFLLCITLSSQLFRERFQFCLDLEENSLLKLEIYVCLFFFFLMNSYCSVGYVIPHSATGLHSHLGFVI